MDVRYVNSFPGIDLNHSKLNSHLPKKFLVTSVGLKKILRLYCQTLLKNIL